MSLAEFLPRSLVIYLPNTVFLHRRYCSIRVLVLLASVWHENSHERSNWQKFSLTVFNCSLFPRSSARSASIWLFSRLSTVSVYFKIKILLEISSRYCKRGCGIDLIKVRIKFLVHNGNTIYVSFIRQIIQINQRNRMMTKLVFRFRWIFTWID